MKPRSYLQEMDVRCQWNPAVIICRIQNIASCNKGEIEKRIGTWKRLDSITHLVRSLLRRRYPYRYEPRQSVHSLSDGAGAIYKISLPYVVGEKKKTNPIPTFQWISHGEKQKNPIPMVQWISQTQMWIIILAPLSCLVFFCIFYSMGYIEKNFSKLY